MKEKDSKRINTEGIPAPIVRGLETVVEMIRGQMPQSKRKQGENLLVKHGRVTGSLHRRDIYDDSVG